MIDLTVWYEVDGQAVIPAEMSEDYELAETLEHTGEQIRRHVEDRLDGLRCPEHGQPPHVRVTIAYDTTSGQMEPSYHLDTCCQMLLLRSVQALNR